MRKLFIFLVLLMQNSTHLQGSMQNSEMRSIDWYLSVAAHRFASFEIGLSYFDFILIAVFLMLGIIHRKRRRINTKIKQRIQELKHMCTDSSDVVRDLGSALENSEVSSLQIVSGVYSSYVAEAVDDVDRVFVAEGL